MDQPKTYKKVLIHAYTGFSLLHLSPGFKTLK